MKELEKAARNYAILPMDVGEGKVCIDRKQEAAFKAGAEWMREQGDTYEAEVIEGVPYGQCKWKPCVKVWLKEPLPKGSKVIVQIRDKEAQQ